MGNQRMTGPERAAQLLDVAEQLFVEQGYDATTLEDIASRAGVSRAVVYQHHGSKEGLYLGCVARARVGLVERSSEALRGVTNAHDALVAAVDVWLAEVERDPKRWELLHTDRVARVYLGREDVEGVLPDNAPFYAAAIGQWARPGLSALRISASVEMVIGTAVGMARWWIRNPEVERAEIVEAVVEFCWRGLSALLPEET